MKIAIVGSRKYPFLNQDIVKNADVVVAFWDGQSRGTAHSMNLALTSGKMLYCKLPDRDIQLVA